MGGGQNYGLFWGTLDIRCRTIVGTQKGTIILITTLFSGLGLRALSLKGSAKH